MSLSAKWQKYKLEKVYSMAPFARLILSFMFLLLTMHVVSGHLTFSVFSYICHYIDREIGSFATNAIGPYVTGDHPMLFARDLEHSCTDLFVFCYLCL